MDLLPLGFLLLIVAVSGGIAYWSDQVGKKLGKKRLSVFGLRPRHVASIGTVLLGVMVSLLTILSVSAASGDVREWIRRGSRAIVELRNTQQNLDLAKQELQERQGDLQRTKKELASRQQEITDLRHRLDDGHKRLDEQKSRLATQQQNIDGLTSRKNALDRQVTDLNGRIERQGAKILTTQSQLKANLNQLKVVQSQIGVVQKQLGVAARDRNQALDEQQRLAHEKDTLVAEIASQRDELKELTQARDALADARDYANKTLQEAQRHLTDVELRLETAQRKYDDLKEAANELYGQNVEWKAFAQSTLAPSRLQPLIYQREEEVVRLPIPANTSADRADAYVTTILRMAKIRAAERGAKERKGAERNYEVADLYPHMNAQTQQTITPEQIRESIVRQIANKPTEQVLIAYSNLNIFKGEPVPLDLDVQPNPLVYQRNEVISESPIDGRQPDDAILQQFSDFVGQKVRVKAQNDHMIPLSKREETFGAVSAHDVIDLVQRVKATGRVVRVQALATDDTRAADPLRLEFRIR